MDTKTLQRAIASIDSAVNPKNLTACKEAQDRFVAECYNIDDPVNKQKTAEQIADVYYKLAECYMNGLDIFGSLHCVLGCRRLHEMVPKSEHVAYQLLQVIAGLSYVKNTRKEDGMVDEYMDEVFELAAKFPQNAPIQRQAAMCIANLVALCGGFDAPLSLAYGAVERMEEVVERLPRDSELQNIFAHILISACYFTNQTDNQARLTQFRTRLERLTKEKAAYVDLRAVRAHLSQVGLS